MSRKRFGVEQVINQLREAEVLVSQGRTFGDICRRNGVSEQNYYRWRHCQTNLNRPANGICRINPLMIAINQDVL